MDLAYDHIASEAANPRDLGDSAATSKPEQQASLNDEIQDAYRAISTSIWGMRIGDFIGNVVKQGESVYTQAQKELAEVGEDATKGLTDLRDSIMNRTRSLTQNTAPHEAGAKEGDDSQSTPTRSQAPPAEDASQHMETVLPRLRSEAAKRLRRLQRAEDAADEAFLRFGSNVRDFLRDAISIAPPEGSEDDTVLFESKDAQGKRVIHTSRFDAQLHVIHTSASRLTEDPAGTEFPMWINDFDIEKKTDDIASDLSRYPELRTTMEKLVPDQVPYAEFRKRYYYLRHGIETAESRRHLLQASAEDDVGWDDSDSDDATPENAMFHDRTNSATSATTLQPPKEGPPKSTEGRKSNDDKSVADSEASYDVVGAASGMTSQAPNSPKEPKKADDSDDDWE